MILLILFIKILLLICLQTTLSLISNNLNDKDKLQFAINTFYNWSVLLQLENSTKKSFSLTLGIATILTYYVNAYYCSSYKDLGITNTMTIFILKSI